MKKIQKIPPAGYECTNELAFVFDPESTYASPYVLCQKWKSGPAGWQWEWVQVPVISLSDEEQQVPPHYLRHHRPGDELPHHLQT
jgi:hypothetical protein